MSAVDQAALRRSSDCGVAFLLSRQRETGFWQDFDLEPGPSDAWVTAYVGRALQAAGGDDVAHALWRAADWLQQTHRPNGGWGYNALTPVDADTTAQVLLFLLGQRRAVPPAAVARLRQFANADGSFRTFDRRNPGHSWGHGHPDVTGTAAQALFVVCGGQAGEVEAAAAYLRAAQRPDGLWQAFWWTTPLYGSLEAVQLLDMCGADYDRERLRHALTSAVSGAFQEALRIRLLVRLGLPQQARAAVAWLLGAQQPDCSWPSLPMLRVTAPSSQLDAPTGPVAADPQRLFTTATVMLALAAYRDGDK